MDVLYNQTNRLIQQTQQCFQVLEENPFQQERVVIDIEEKLSAINSNCKKLDVFVYKVPAYQRQNVKMRCDQLKYDARHLQAALEMWKQKKARKEEAAHERKLLLNRKFQPNPEETMIAMDYGLQQRTALDGAHRGIDEMLVTGNGTLESLRSQRITLKGAQRRIMDMFNTLGLSNHTMRLIERRASQDKIVLLAGMLVTLSVIVLVIVYVA